MCCRDRGVERFVREDRVVRSRQSGVAVMGEGNSDRCVGVIGEKTWLCGRDNGMGVERVVREK